MPSIRIRVGASLDANALKVFEPLEKAAERARGRLQKSFNQSGEAGAKSAKTTSSAWEKLERELERDANKILRERERSEKAATRDAEREIKKRERAEQAAQREIQRELAKTNRIRAREDAEATRHAEEQARRRRAFWFGSGGHIGFGHRASWNVPRAVAGAYGLGGAAVGTLLRGAGVDTDVEGMLRRGVEYEAAAQATINAAPSMTGKSLGERRAAAGGLIRQAQRVGVETAVDPGEVIAATRRFVALTGDFDTAKESIGEIARLARATGSSLEDMAASSAEVVNHISDTPDKAKVMLAVMRAIAGQGKLGAVEIRDMARQMAKLASQAPKFEGDQAKTIAVLGALAQMTKLRGGATSAGQATTSVARFVTGLSVPTTFKHWQAFGLSPFTDASRTTMREAPELILEALKATKGDLIKLYKLFPSQQGVRTVQALAATYKEAGGGQKGLEAVVAEFKKFQDAAMTEEEVTRALNAQLATTQARTQIFNNRMQELAQQLQSALLPAVEALAPKIVAIATGLSEWLSQLMGTGPATAEQRGTEAAGKEAKSEELLRKTARVEKTKEGKEVKVYREDLIDTMIAQGAERSAAAGQLAGEIYKTEDVAKVHEVGARNPINRLLDRLGVTHHAETVKEDTETLRRMREQQEALLKENQKQNDTLRDVFLEIKRGNARKEKPRPVQAHPGGTMESNSPEPD